MHESLVDGRTVRGIVEAIQPGESITLDGETYPLAAAANIEPGVAEGQHVELIVDGTGIVTSVTLVDRAPPAPPPPPPPPSHEPPVPSEPAEEDGEVRMTLVEHLEELRQRLIKSAIALAVTTSLSLIFAKRALVALISLLPPEAPHPQALRPVEAFVVYLKVAALLGIALAMPVIVYQFLAFVMPGLKPHEKRYLYFVIPGATLLFIAGLAFTFWVILPFGIPVLVNFLGDVIVQQWAIDYYVSFVVRFLLAVGLVFETPLIMFFLAKVGVITPQTLARSRRYAVVIAAIVAAVLTPTTDPFTMLLVMGPLILLYEFGVLLAKLA